jgi:ADP-ribosyl-[dinitrogen reductase] hydrolase
VDEEAEQLIRSRLLAAFPDWGYRGEETGSTGVNPPPQYLWLVDPNDGTASYLQGYRGSAVSIALLRDRQPVLGVVFAPCAPDDDGDLITWAEGCGPMLRNGEPVVRDPWPEQLGPYDIVLVSQDADRSPEANLHAVAPARYRAQTSIAYRLALAAVGEASLGTSLKGAGDWDYAGGQALLRATGADLFHQDGKVAGYSPYGQSVGRACFGGAPALIPGLLDRPWSLVLQWGTRDPHIPSNLRQARLPPGGAIPDAALLRRAQGCLLGQLVGDALGSLVEFGSPEEIARRYPNGVRELEDGGVWNTIAGQPTDDSELALVLARSLSSSGMYDPEVAARAYAYWYQSQPFDVGSTIGQALRAIPALSSLPWGTRENGAAEHAVAAANRGSQANGSLMRISPLGIWGHDLDPDTLADGARADSRLTHPHPVCREACAAFVLAIAYAVATGAGPAETHAYALDWARRRSGSEEVVAALEAAERGKPADFMHQSGWVLTALQNAFYQLLHAERFEAGLVDTVMSGGDTDTNAAIAGALLGAVHGRAAIPSRWRRLVLSCRPMAGLPSIHRPRPEPFWPVDALELAERLLMARRA